MLQNLKQTVQANQLSCQCPDGEFLCPAFSKPELPLLLLDEPDNPLGLDSTTALAPDCVGQCRISQVLAL